MQKNQLILTNQIYYRMTSNIRSRKPLIILFLLITATGLLISLLIFEKNGKTTEPEKMIQKNKNTVFVTDTSIFQSVKKFNSPDSSAFEIHYDAVLVDGHNDFLYQMYKRGANFGEKGKKTQTGLPRFEEGGVDLQIFAIWIPPEKFKKSKSFVLSGIEMLKEAGHQYPDRFGVAYTYKDIVEIILSGRMAGLTSIEGGTAIEDDLDNINEFKKLGITYIGLTWNNSNKIGTSASDEHKTGKGGLTEFGKKVVKRMNETGIIIDVSHLGEKSFWDVIEITESPIMASHSNCYVINPHYRNLTDAQIKAIAKTGGIVMVNFHNPFVSSSSSEDSPNANKIYGKELNEIYERNKNDLKEFNKERAEFLSSIDYKNNISIDDVIDHIDHIKNLVGVDYIGIGSDFDGGINPPFDLYDGTCYPLLTKKLAERGYTETEIRKILGLNFLRVFKQVCG